MAVRFNEGMVDSEPGPEGGLGTVLEPIYPNPATDRASVGYRLPRPATVRVTVYDLHGRELAVLAEGPRASGPHTAALDTTRLAAGTYLVRLEAEGHVQTQRVTVTR